MILFLKLQFSSKWGRDSLFFLLAIQINGQAYTVYIMIILPNLGMGNSNLSTVYKYLPLGIRCRVTKIPHTQPHLLLFPELFRRIFYASNINNFCL